MFNSEIVVFSRDPPNLSQSSRASGAQAHTSHEREPHNDNPIAPIAVIKDNASATFPRNRMNLSRSSRFWQPERKPPRRENILQQRKLEHRLSDLGQHIRLETLEFGILKNQNFSAEYCRNLLEEGGYFSFEDDEKSLRISIGGSHRDPSMPSIAIAIQTVNKITLGYDFGVPYMFLELLLSPHFELGDTARPSTGNAKEDARCSRTRHSALDSKHERVAPFTSRWLKLYFYKDEGFPSAQLCLRAGLPAPDINPKLTFEKLNLYSLQIVGTLEKWLQGNSLPWEVAFQCEALYRNGTLVPHELLELRPMIESLLLDSATRTSNIIKTFREGIEGTGSWRSFGKFKHKSVIEAFKKHIDKNDKAASLDWLQTGSSGSSFICYHVTITPTAVFLTGMCSIVLTTGLF